MPAPACRARASLSHVLSIVRDRGALHYAMCFGVSPSGKSNYRKDANENRPRAHGYSASRRPVVLQPRNRRPDPQSRCLCRAFLRVRQPLDRLGSLHACPPRHPHRSLQLPRAPWGHRALRCDAAGLPARERQLLHITTDTATTYAPVARATSRSSTPGITTAARRRPVGQPHR